MTILVNFHQSQYRTFKDYYLKEVCLHLRWAFPNLVSYNRFVALKSEVMFAASVIFTHAWVTVMGFLS